MTQPPPYAGYQIAKHKSLDAHAVANDGVEHCAWRKGVRPIAARMRADLSAEVGALSVPVVIDPTVPSRSIYFEIPRE